MTHEEFLLGITRVEAASGPCTPARSKLLEKMYEKVTAKIWSDAIGLIIRKDESKVQAFPQPYVFEKYIEMARENFNRHVDEAFRPRVVSAEKVAPMDRLTFEQGKVEIEKSIETASTPKLKRFHEMCLRGHIREWNKSQGLPYEAIVSLEIPKQVSA